MCVCSASNTTKYHYTLEMTEKAYFLSSCHNLSPPTFQWAAAHVDNISAFQSVR